MNQVTLDVQIACEVQELPSEASLELWVETALETIQETTPVEITFELLIPTKA